MIFLWLKRYLLTSNAKKSEFMIFTFKNSNLNIGGHFELFAHNCNIGSNQWSCLNWNSEINTNISVYKSIAILALSRISIYLLQD